MKAFWAWCQNKFGRIVTGLGILFAGIDTLDLTVIKDPIVNLFGNRAFQYATVVCFALSWIRHQQVANKVGKP